MTTIFWAGDSTVKQNSMLTYPQTGVGQVFERFTRRCAVRLENHAENGRSTKSFLEEGRLFPILEGMQPGDFLFIQFGHNDQKAEDPARYAPADTIYSDNLRLMIREAKSRGGIPVLISPLTRCHYRTLPKERQHAPWAQAMQRVAAEEGVAFIDLTRMSEEAVDGWGETAQEDLYMTLPKGKYPHYPDGLSDTTHLQPLGAMVFASLIAKGLYGLGGIYAALLSDEYEAWLSEGGQVLP